MTRSTVRSILAALAAAPIALAGSVATAPAASAAPTVEAASFSGTFSSTCDMPTGPEGPEDGPYSCDHTATSVGCAAVVDTGPTTSYVKICKANLNSGTTSGSANNTYYPYNVWTCENGAGTGMFEYQPSSADPSFEFQVNLQVIGHNVVVSGSYTHAGTGRHIVVRAQFPAVCNFNTTGGDYTGTVSPI